MKRYIRVLILAVLMVFVSCTKDSDCQNDPGKRSGAVCKDGTSSTATGSGACSGHGGVDHWTCK